MYCNAANTYNRCLKNLYKFSLVLLMLFYEHISNHNKKKFLGKTCYDGLFSCLDIRFLSPLPSRDLVIGSEGVCYIALCLLYFPL